MDFDDAAIAVNLLQIAILVLDREPDVSPPVHEHPVTREIPAAVAWLADLSQVDLVSGHGIDAIDVRSLTCGLTGEEDIEIVSRRIDADCRIRGESRAQDAVVTPLAGRELVAKRVRPGPGGPGARLLGGP